MFKSSEIVGSGKLDSLNAIGTHYAGITYVYATLCFRPEMDDTQVDLRASFTAQGADGSGGGDYTMEALTEHKRAGSMINSG